MATGNQKKLHKLITPPAPGAYAWLQQPDEGQEYSDGKYKVTLLFEKGTKETKTFLTALKEKANEAATDEWSKVPKDLILPYRDGDEKDRDDFKDMWMFTAKTKFRPGMYDSATKPLDEGSEPRSGDIIRVSFKLYPYKNTRGHGVSAQLVNVQLIDKRNVTPDSEFGEFEGGYVAAVSEGDSFDDDDF